MRKNDKRNVEQRSVEEVILRRKLEKMAISESKSMPSLNPDKSRGGFLPAIAGASPGPVTLSSGQQIPMRSINSAGRLTEQQNEEPQKMYSEKDVRKMMENVMKYCRVLQTRVQELEVEAITGQAEEKNQPSADFHQSPVNNTASTVRFAPTNTISNTNQIELSKSSKNPQENKPRNQDSQRGLDDPLINREIVASLDNKIGALRDIFRQVDPMEERRVAAVKIQAIIRGYLAKARKRYYYQGVREWRWVRCRPVIWVLDILLSNQSKLDSGFHLLKMNRTMKTLTSVYTKWAAVYRQNAPMRRAMRRSVEDRIRDRRHEFMLKHFIALRDVTIGLKSRKHANNERRKMIDQIRANLSKKLILDGDLGVVPDSEVMKVLNRRVVEEFQVRKKTLSLQYKFRAFKKLVEMAHAFQKAARVFRFRQNAGKCFYAWSDFTYLKSRGLDRKRWPGPRKYEVRYNQKRVDNFARVRCERLIFHAWKAYYGIQHIVKVKFQHKVALFMKEVFSGWKSVAKHQHELRLQTYQNWIGYAGLMTQGPFKAWADFVKGQKNQYHEHVRIAKSYRRWKSRQKLAQIVKVWRHQALFGRLDGLYTRQMLLKTLGEQKMFTSTLEKLMSDQTLELDECKRLLHEEIDKRKNGESEITQLNNTINHLKMTNHHYEQELKRLNATVESMAMINPKQMQHMQEKMPEFKFRERHIALGTNTEDLSLLAPTAATTAPVAGDASTTENKDKDASTAAGDENTNKDKAAVGDLTTIKEDGDTAKPAEDATKAASVPPAVDTAQALAMKLMDGLDGSGHNSGLGGSATPNAANDGTKTTADQDAKNAKPQDPDQLPPVINTLDNQRLLERVKWIIERYKQCNPMDFEFPVLSATRTPTANTRASTKGESMLSTNTQQANAHGKVDILVLDDSNTANTAGTVGTTATDGSATEHQQQQDQQLLEEEEGYEDFENDGLGATRSSISAGKSRHTRSNSYMTIANSSLPGLKLPDPLTRSPSKSLLRASNPFVKGVVTDAFSPGTSFNIRASTMSAAGENANDNGNNNNNTDMNTGSPPPHNAFSDSPSPLQQNHKMRSKSKRGKSLAAPSFDDSPSSPAPMLRKSPSKLGGTPTSTTTAAIISNNNNNKSFRASFSRQASISFAPGMFAPALQAVQNVNNSSPASNSNLMGSPPGGMSENMIMAMGYDPRSNMTPITTAGEVFYDDNELEDIVITWAKMLFTIMEFLESGDITNLPMEDKRLWALHLLDKDRYAKNTLSLDDQMALNVDLSGIGGGAQRSNGDSNMASSRVLSANQSTRNMLPGASADPHALVTQALLSSSHLANNSDATSTSFSSSNRPMTPSRPSLHAAGNIMQDPSTKNLVEQALMTVDERVHGGVSWREALLKLRTMFPGAGNFSGFGVAIEEATDTAFFQRLLTMRKELQKVEDVQTHRFQKNMLEQMAAAEQDALLAATRNNTLSSPAKKSFAEWKAEKNAERERTDLAEQNAFYDSKRQAGKPLGTDIYASNLKKLLEVERAEAEEEAAAARNHNHKK